MRYSISNAIPHNPKSEKHPYENLVNGGFLCYIKVGGRKLEVTVIKLTHAWDQANGESSGLRNVSSHVFRVS